MRGFLAIIALTQSAYAGANAPHWEEHATIGSWDPMASWMRSAREKYDQTQASPNWPAKSREKTMEHVFWKREEPLGKRGESFRSEK